MEALYETSTFNMNEQLTRHEKRLSHWKHEKKLTQTWQIAHTKCVLALMLTYWLIFGLFNFPHEEGVKVKFTPVPNGNVPVNGNQEERVAESHLLRRCVILGQRLAVRNALGRFPIYCIRWWNTQTLWWMHTVATRASEVKSEFVIGWSISSE